MSADQDPRRPSRVGARLGRRLVIALVAGPLIGAIVGVIISALVLDGWGRAAAGVVIGSIIACTMLALLWSGYSSLESPDPGHEPSDTDPPLADGDELVRKEHGDPLADVPGHGLHRDTGG